MWGCPLHGRCSQTGSILYLPGWASEKLLGGTPGVTDKETVAKGESGTSQVLTMSQGQNWITSWAQLPMWEFLFLFHVLIYKQNQNMKENSHLRASTVAGTLHKHSNLIPTTILKMIMILLLHRRKTSCKKIPRLIKNPKLVRRGSRHLTQVCPTLTSRNTTLSPKLTVLLFGT